MEGKLLNTNFSAKVQGKSFCHFTLYPFPVMFFRAAVRGIPHAAERTGVFIRCWGSQITQMASIIIDNKNNYHHFRQPFAHSLQLYWYFKTFSSKAFRLQIGIQTGWEKIIINQKVSVLIPDLIDIPRLPVTMMIDRRVMKHFQPFRVSRFEFNWQKGK